MQPPECNYSRPTSRCRSFFGSRTLLREKPDFAYRPRDQFAFFGRRNELLSPAVPNKYGLGPAENIKRNMLARKHNNVAFHICDVET